MSTISSKQTKKQGLIDPMLFLLFLASILIFVLLSPFATDAYNPTQNLFSSFNPTSNRLSASTDVSFAADLRYWEFNCSRGWSGNAACEAIVARSQSCAISVDSAYCSEYASYMEQFNK